MPGRGGRAAMDIRRREVLLRPGKRPDKGPAGAEELCDWRDSIVHKINIVRLISLDTTRPGCTMRCRNILHAEPAPVRRRRPAAAGPPAGERRDQRTGHVP